MKKQKEEFEVTALKLQEQIIRLELEKMTWSSMDVEYASELTMYLLSPRKQQIAFI